MLVFGIDVGVDGAIAALGDNITAVIRMPIIHGTPSGVPGKRGSPSKLDGTAIKAWLIQMVEQYEAIPNGISLDEAYKRCVVSIEKQQAMPKQGLVSTFHLGESFGILQGLTMGLGMPMVLVGPKQWKKVVLEGTAMDKTAAINYVKQRYPGIDINVGKRKEILHDGMADAMCIAHHTFTASRSSGTPIDV